jgi:predicted ATPase/class 3 adenylate cyclase
MEYPTGTVTFLFTDIEGSTKLAQDHPESWEEMRHRHHAILYSAIEIYHGFVFQIIGDAFCAAFHTAGDALRAALKAQIDLLAEPWGEAAIKVRMGIHTGKAEIQGGSEYQGYLTMSRVQRVMSVAYGGQVLVSNPSCELMRGELPEGASLLDMKEHRLKGLLNPEHLWQAVAPGLPRDFPPLHSLNDIPNNLPIKLTSFIGRENEITELKRELNDHLLVTLTGSGGTGKTRLSLQVAAEVIDFFPDGVWFLELAPVTDPDLVPGTLANLFGLRESSETKHSISELICGYLQSRKALLVFDNCEHLIDACARLADQLLRSCKDLRILASSREALGVEGEMAWHVPSLSLPDLKKLPNMEQLSQYEAVRLFIERASLVQPHFSLSNENAPAVAQVCSRLDGIPLAIELAAARANVLAVEQIAKRLDDRFRLLTGGARTALPRQQTLRAMIDWSYNLLSEEERLLFRRLAVFVGGWTLEAAEAICGGDGIDSFLVLDLLSQLVKKSLVVMADMNGESRYHELETIRQYAREKLFETEEAALIRNAHLDFFIQLAEQGFEELWGPNDLIWIGKLETENDNFRSALSWSLKSTDVDPQKALQLSGALQDFWDTLGYTLEGYQWLSEAIKKAPIDPTSQRCRALHGAGFLCVRLSRFKDAGIYLEEGLLLARQLNIGSFLVISLLWSGYILDDRNESIKRWQEGINLARSTCGQEYLALILSFWANNFTEDATAENRYIQEAYEIAGKRGNSRMLANVLRIYGGIQMRRGNADSATTMLQEAVRLSHLLKDKHTTAISFLILGRIATWQNEFKTASRYHEECLQILHDISDRGCAFECLFHLGWNAYLAGEMEQAKKNFHEGLLICNEIGFSDLSMMPEFALGRIAVEKEEFEAARSFFLSALEAHKKSPDSPYFLAYCLEAVCEFPGFPHEKSVQLLGWVAAIREKKGYVLGMSERHLVDPLIEKMRSQLGLEAYNSAFASGMVMTFQEAIEEAIQDLQRIK